MNEVASLRLLIKWLCVFLVGLVALVLVLNHQKDQLVEQMTSLQSQLDYLQAKNTHLERVTGELRNHEFDGVIPDHGNVPTLEQEAK